MGMGIESWCYNNLGKPDLKIIDRVSVNLMNFKPHWITEDQTITYKNTIGKPSTKTRILLSGGCDLKQLSNQLEKHFILETEFNYMDANINIRKDHSELILAKHCDELEEIISHIPFISMKSIGSMMFSNFFDAVVISPLMDFHQGCYKHKLSGHIIPKDSFEIDLTDINRLDKTRLHKRGAKFLKWFSENFDYIGPLSPKKFKNNVREIKSRLSKECRLFYLTAPEIDYKYPEIDFTYPGTKSQHYTRHCVMNEALEELKDNDVIELIDIRGIIFSENDIEQNNVYHYTRNNYHKISLLIKNELINKLSLKKGDKWFFNQILISMKRDFDYILNWVRGKFD